MKNLLKFMFVFLALGVIVASCSDDDDNVGPKPVISNLEVGGHHHHHHAATRAEEKHVGHIGEDLHVAADILAANKIAKVVVKIHEAGHHHAATRATEFEFKKEFVDLKGQVNGKFHHHIDIPKTAEPGEYHFHFEVVDEAGLSTEKEVHLHLEVEDEE